MDNSLQDKLAVKILEILLKEGFKRHSIDEQISPMIYLKAYNPLDISNALVVRSDRDEAFRARVYGGFSIEETLVCG